MTFFPNLHKFLQTFKFEQMSLVSLPESSLTQMVSCLTQIRFLAPFFLSAREIHITFAVLKFQTFTRAAQPLLLQLGHGHVAQAWPTGPDRNSAAGD